MDFPKVTVVTATYNLIKAGRAESIVQAIESVHAQKYEGEIEHLIIDGASSDGTLDILAPFSEKGWVTIFSEKDKGLYDAMNKGIAKASGKYTVILNSDDYWSSELAVQKSVEALEREQADFSYGKYRTEKDGVIGRIKGHGMGVFFLRMPFCHQTMFTKTEVLKELGGFNAEKYRSAADYDLVLRAILAGKKSVFVDLDFVVFRMGGFSVDLSVSEPEVIDSMYSAYGRLTDISKDECSVLFYEFLFPSELYTSIKQRVSPEIIPFMEEEFKSFEKNGNMCRYIALHNSSHLSPLGDEEFFARQQKNTAAAELPSYGKKDMFSRCLFYSILSFLHLGGKRVNAKLTREKMKIKSLSVEKGYIFGVCVYKKYYGNGVSSYQIFKIPILTFISQ